MSSILFTPQRRTEIADNLTAFFRADEDIVGVVWVGSGAQGFHDDYSDIDLLVVVRNGAVYPSVYAKWLDRIQTLYTIIACYEARIHEYERELHLLLDNFLGLDLTIVRQSRLNVHHQPYRIAFDKGNELPAIIQRTLETEATQAPRANYQAYMGRVWKDITQCTNAIKRDETWFALYLLEDIRRTIVALAGIAHHVDTQQPHRIDDLPEMFLVHLRHTIPASTSTASMRRALTTSVLLLFELAHTIETNLQLPADARLASPLQERLLTFIEAYS